MGPVVQPEEASGGRNLLVMAHTVIRYHRRRGNFPQDHQVAGGMTVEPIKSDKLIDETGGAAFGALMGLAFGGPLGATAGAAVGVLLTPLGERWIAKCRQEFHSRGRVLAEAASLTSGLGEAEVVERLLESEELQPMVARVLDAASRTNSTDTLRLLGGVLGESVGNRPRRIDEDLMLVDGITGLEPGHLRVLEQMESPADPSNPSVFWIMETIAAASAHSLSPAGLRAAIGGLLARGLIQSMSGFDDGDGGGYRITEFGGALLGALRRSRPLDQIPHPASRWRLTSSHSST